MKVHLSGLRLRLHRALKSKEIKIRGVRLHASEGFVPRSVQSALYKKKWERAESRLLESVLRPQHRVLEIGAGIGFTSLLATKLTQEGQVLSYEANPAMRRVIEANFRLNDLTPNLRMRAITRDGSKVRFFVEQNPQSSSLLQRSQEATLIQVESDAIGDVIEAHRPDVILMDAEGAERELIAAANFETVDFLIIEFHRRLVGEAQADSSVRCLENSGFEVVKRLGKRHVLFENKGTNRESMGAAEARVQPHHAR